MDRSSTLFNEAKNYIPGGVNSPVRAFKGVGGDSIYFASNCDIELFKKFYKSMIRQGVYFAPSAYECGFLSAAHTKNELDETINAALTAFSEL